MRSIKITWTTGWVISLVFAAQTGFTAGPPTLKSKPKSGVQKVDFGVFGPRGKAMVYYQDKNTKEIVIHNCQNELDIGKIIRSRKDCEMIGSENRVPLESFKLEITRAFQILDPDKLKPFTPAELKVIKASNPHGIAKLKAQEAIWNAKLNAINELIAERGEDPESKQIQDERTKLLAEVRKELTTAGAGTAAIKKMNALIADLVDKKIANSNEWHWVSAEEKGSDSTKGYRSLLYNLLKQYDAIGGECGTDEILRKRGVPPEGDLPEGGTKGTWLENFFIQQAIAANPFDPLQYRINDCRRAFPNSKKVTAGGVTWNLVARQKDPETGRFYEAWQDSQTGLVWGDQLKGWYTHDNFHKRDGRSFAVTIDEQGKITEETACAVSDAGKLANAGVSEKKFGLPTISEWKRADLNGMQEALPNMLAYYEFWTADPGDKESARTLMGNGHILYPPRENSAFVRCVGR